MESQRSLLFIIFLAVSYMLYSQWQLDHAPKTEVVSQNTVASATATPTGEQDYVPPASSQQTPESTTTVASAQQVEVNTDLLDVVINTQGGDIVLAKLRQYDTELHSGKPVTILEQNPHLYVAQSGLTGANGIDRIIKGRPVYHVAQNSYNLGEQQKLAVDLVYNDSNALTVTKRFTFTKGSYAIDVEYIVQNNSQSAASVELYAQLKQSTEKDTSSGMMPTAAYWGSAYSTDEERYEKFKWGDFEDTKLNKTTQGGWIAMIQHYFVSAWIPNKDQQNLLYSNYDDNKKLATLGFKAPATTIAAGAKETVKTTFYVGPKDQDALAKIAENLDLTIDYGFLFMISQPLFWLLVKIQSLVHNWGLAIIVITLIIKGGMYPLTKAQYTSMAKMRELQPKLQALKERFGSDRQKFGQATMELYRKEKVNPAGGCLPILIQMPIFMALYWVFLESVELRHASFALWIHDLSSKDPYYILPILMGASMFIMQKMQPMTVQDPMQQKMMQYMPVMFTFFFLWFPSGLVLYWLVSNLISIAQMKIIFAGIEKKKAAKAAAKA